MKKYRAEAMQVTDRLPDVFGHGGGGQFRSDLKGATILQIGSPDDPRLVEGGGLVIDYLPMGHTRARRIVLAFTELGMRVAKQCSISQPSTAASRQG